MRCLLTNAVAVLLLSATFAAADATKDESTDQRIAQWIEQLGDAQFSVRQRAQQELIKHGADAFDALIEAEHHQDPEVAMQAGYLVRTIRAEWIKDSDPRPIQQILKDYELLPDDQRVKRIRQLADLPHDQGLPWLCRLVRFEKSYVLSKQAALAIIGRPVDDTEEAKARRATTIKQAFGQARRPAALWLLASLEFDSHPAAALEQWSALTEAERKTLEQHPQETRADIVMELLRRKVELLDRLGRSDETLDVLRQMVLCERGDTDSLSELIEWLSKRKAWPVIDELAVRFVASFEVDAMLMYTLCEARLAQGNREAANEAAEKALKIHGDSPAEHASIAERLMDRGLVEWSDREWRHMISLGQVGSTTDFFARDRLSNSLHDRALDQEAGQVLKDMMDAADRDANVMQRLRAVGKQNELNPDVIRANMNYFFACDAGRRQERAKQREYLDKALEQDRTNVEVLIALYQLTADEPAKRAEIVKQIKEVVEFCRGRIEEANDDPTYYNQIAWLVANTEGDLEEATRFSQKSVELARASGETPKRIGGLLDTLGHCYFAKKDYATAVKYQTEAAQLDAHSQAIRRQLAVFRQALEKQHPATEK